MTAFTRTLFAAIAGFMLVQLPALAASLSLSGSCSWQVSGSSINISAGKVSNESSSGISGTVRVQVWATSYPYSGGSISGYVLGTRTLGQLSAGYYYNGVSGYVSYKPPPSGYYYTTMTVEEYTGSGYVIRDYLTFDGTSYFGSGGGGGGAADVELEGAVGWSVSAGRINITASRVSNSGGARSGTLRLQIWATTSPYAGGTIYGYTLGTRTLSPLPGGYSYRNISGYVPFTPPPAGVYYTTITLEEYTGSGFVIRDYVTFSSSSMFGSGNGGLNGAPGGSGSGVQMIGRVSYNISPLRGVTIKSAKVLNDRFSGVSGTLILRLWATDQPYYGGTLNGYILGTKRLGQLEAGYYYYNIVGTSEYSPPPPGKYYPVLTLEEFNGSGYTIVDWVNFSKRLRVR